MLNKFVPVQVIENGNRKIWYMDIDNLSLTELIDLKSELNGNYVNSIAVIDSIILREAGYTYQDIKSIKRKNIVDKKNHKLRKRKGRR